MLAAGMSEIGAVRPALAGVLSMAFALRCGWVGLATLDPSDGQYFDMVFYHISALQLAAGNGYTRLDGTPTAVWPPLYPVLLAVVYALSDGSFLLGKLANALFGTFTALFTYLIGCRLVSRRVGLLAAAFFAACPDDIFFSNFVMSEPAFGAIFTGGAWLFTVLNQRRPAAGAFSWFALGGAVALASLTRGVAAAWLGVPILIWIAGSRSLRASSRQAAALLLGFACVLAPWTIRNALQMGAPIPIATSLGRTLGHAHSPFQRGGASPKGLLYWRRIADRFEHLPQPQRELTVNRVLTRLSLEYMLTHPGHELRILPARFYHLFEHGHVGLEIGRPKLESGEMKPFFGPGRHRAIAGFADAYFYTLLALGLLGLARFFRHRDATALVVPLSAGYFTALHVLLFPDDPRYHLPMLPFLALSAAWLLVGWSERLRSQPETLPGVVSP
jgi:4-amino-4-deoxy-L-arabinose transferase-like glycosyltransferase